MATGSDQMVLFQYEAVRHGCRAIYGKLALAAIFSSVLGCACSKKVHEHHLSRNGILRKSSDSVFTFDLRKPVYYGEFCNLLADELATSGSSTEFITIKFTWSGDSSLAFRTYLPRRLKPGESADTTQYFVTLGSTDRIANGIPLYTFQIEDNDKEILTLDEIERILRRIKVENGFSGLLFVLFPGNSDMKSDVVPILDRVGRFSLPKTSFAH